MRHHRFEPTTPRPVSAVTFDERWFGVRSTYPLARSYYNRRWNHGSTESSYQLNRVEPVLITFSDGSYGVVSEDQLADALDEYNITLADD